MTWHQADMCNKKQFEAALFSSPSWWGQIQFGLLKKTGFETGKRLWNCWTSVFEKYAKHNLQLLWLDWPSFVF